MISGAVPAVADPKAERGSLAAYGDTRTQTLSVLGNIERQLKGKRPLAQVRHGRR